MITNNDLGNSAPRQEARTNRCSLRRPPRPDKAQTEKTRQRSLHTATPHPTTNQPESSTQPTRVDQSRKAPDAQRDADHATRDIVRVARGLVVAQFEPCPSRWPNAARLTGAHCVHRYQRRFAFWSLRTGQASPSMPAIVLRCETAPDDHQSQTVASSARPEQSENRGAMQSTLTSESEQGTNEMAGMTIASSTGSGRSVTHTRAQPGSTAVLADKRPTRRFRLALDLLNAHRRCR